MLAVIVLQGTGILHALHLTIEHAPSSGHGGGAKHCCYDHGARETAHSSGEAAMRLHDGQGSHAQAHHHATATCPVCQVLAKIKAISSDPHPGLSTELPPALDNATSESFPLTPLSLASLGPRAPPISV